MQSKYRSRPMMVLVALSLLVMVPSPFVSTASTKPDEQFTVSAPPTSARHTGVNLDDSQSMRYQTPYMEAFTSSTGALGGAVTSFKVCSKFGDPDCDESRYVQYRAHLPICEVATQSNCVQSIQATKNGTALNPIFVKNFPETNANAYPGSLAANLPASGSNFIVRFPDIPHAGGDEYLIIAQLEGDKDFGKSQFTVTDFKAGIFAISRRYGNFSMSRPADFYQKTAFVGGRAMQQGGTDNDSKERNICVQNTATECAISWPLPLEVEFSLALRMSTKISGWLHGRLSDVRAEISSDAQNNQIVKVSGKPVIVPGIHKWIQKDSFPTKLRDFYDRQGPVAANTNGAGYPGNDANGRDLPWGEDGFPYSILKEQFGFDDGGIAEYLAWLDAVGDRASTAPTAWSVKSIQNNSSFQACSTSVGGLTGIVTTNASMYVAGPPVFNASEQTLDYKVAAPHLLPSGKEFLGIYNLAMQSNVARCIYGYTDAPVSASVSIVSGEGTASVATASLGERAGWLYLEANGFTFSAPVIKVKLSQAAVGATPTPTPTATSTGTPSATTTPAAVAQTPRTPNLKKSTITCTKGIKIKKITSQRPKCPKGYQKK